MDQLLRILLIEDDILECNAMQSYVENAASVELVGIANTVESGLELTQLHLPDAIILDLELHKGGGNGIQFLNKLQQLQISMHPYVLITTNNISNVTHDLARKCGADFIMVKSQSDYSAGTVIEFLKSLKGILQNASRKGTQSPELITTESPEQLLKRMLKRIHVELEKVGVSPKLIGKKYLTDAIALLIQETSVNIAAEIAQKYGKTTASVERAMQNAINCAWKTADIEDLSRYYTAHISSSKGIPTIMEFVHYYADKIRHDM